METAERIWGRIKIYTQKSSHYASGELLFLCFVPVLSV